MKRRIIQWILLVFILLFSSTTLSDTFSNLSKSQAEVFTGTDTFTQPTGVTWVRVLLVAGGGSGGGGDSDGAFAGGGGGGGEIVVRDMYITGDLTITIGAGGAEVNEDVDGNDGSNSTVTDGSTTITAHGGKGGSKGAGADGAGGDGGGNDKLYKSDASQTMPDTTVNRIQTNASIPGGAGGKGGTTATTIAAGIPGYGDAGVCGAADEGGGGGASYGDGADSNSGASGSAAAANSGGGGAGGADSGSYHGGAGGSGYCIIFYVR